MSDKKETKLYKLTYGLTGGYNMSYTEFGEFNSENNAEQAAYELAVENYESSGIAELQGVTFDDFYDECIAQMEENEEEVDEAYAEDYAEAEYNEAMESWITYQAELATEEEYQEWLADQAKQKEELTRK